MARRRGSHLWVSDGVTPPLARFGSDQLRGREMRSPEQRLEISDQGVKATAAVTRRNCRIRYSSGGPARGVPSPSCCIDQSGMGWRSKAPGGTPHALKCEAPSMRSIAQDVHPYDSATLIFAASRSSTAACAAHLSDGTRVDARASTSACSDSSGSSGSVIGESPSWGARFGAFRARPTSVMGAPGCRRRPRFPCWPPTRRPSRRNLRR